jgi:hypothetical protein
LTYKLMQSTLHYKVFCAAEGSVLDEQARDDLALIRQALDDGHRYATRSGPGMMIWGIALAAGFVATYARVRQWSPLGPAVVWPVAMAVPWAWWLTRMWSRNAGRAAPLRSPTIEALRMLWLGLGIFLTSLTLIVLWSGAHPSDWLAAVAAGAMGAAVFATAWLAAIPWLRWIAVAWWIGEVALFFLRDCSEMLLVAAALMLLLFVAPGAALTIRARRFAVA